MWRRISVSVLAALFGLVLIAAGNEVYNIGTQKLEEATEESCKVVQKLRKPCIYDCGGMFSPTKQCHGFSYVYTSDVPEKCGTHNVTFDERDVLRSINVTMCRCGPSEPPGDCWLDASHYSPNVTYPCTVRNTCRDFDFVIPSDIRKTGIVNIVLGIIFVVFAACPETFIDHVGNCLAACGKIIVMDIIVPGATLCVEGITAWLTWVRTYTAAPAKGYLSEEEPLLA